jgi:hypothetical protein
MGRLYEIYPMVLFLKMTFEYSRKFPVFQDKPITENNSE